MARRSQKEYEVERIVKAKVAYKRNRNISWRYLVKWKGYGDSANTWEPFESFEESPKLIDKFWKKVDLGERDPRKAKYFSIREELVPRDETWSDEDAEGEEGEEEKGKAGEESVSPQVGKKRSSAGEGSPKRKRGRPSKAEKEVKETEESATKKSEAEVKEKTSDAEDGESASRRSSRRLSENQMISANLASDARLKTLIRPFSTGDSSSEDEMPPVRKESAKVIRKSLLKRRKAYIESDEEDDGVDQDDAASSHDGSLFSGDESDEEEQKEQANPTESLAPELNVHEPAVIPQASSTPEPLQESKKTKPNVDRLGRPRKPAVIMIEDPNIGKARDERIARVLARVQGQALNPTGSVSTGIESTASTGREAVSYRPTLLTVEKGKLTSQRNKVVRPSRWEPPKPSTHITIETIATNSADLGDSLADSPISPSNAAEGADVQNDMLDSFSPQDVDAMDTSPDFPSLENVVGSIQTPDIDSSEKIPSGPPPTAEELLQLSGANYEADELPDFDGGEDVEETSSAPMPTAALDGTGLSSSSSQEPSVAPAVGELPAWKQTNIFSLPTPNSILQKINPSAFSDPLPPAKPERLVLPLRLGPGAIVPVVLKDIDAARGGLTMAELLKPNQLDGPLGKLFPQGMLREVLRCVTKAGSSARIVPDDDCSDEQRLWFSKLVDELEQESLFIIDIAGNTFMLCSSENKTARWRLLLVTSNTGLSRTVLIQHIPIVDATLYASCVMKARILQLN